MSERIENVAIEGAKLIFTNFAGEPDKFNPKGGRRSFSVILPDYLAKDMESEGWNVKYLRPRDEEEEPTPIIQVRINYGAVAPNIFMIAGKKKTRLDEDTVGLLDSAEIANADLEIRPYQWEVNGKTGVTAYVKTLYVTIREDVFASKYADDDMEIPFD